MRAFFGSAFITTAAIVMVPQAALAKPAPSALNGTWKLDPAASKFSSPALKSETRTYRVTGNRVKLTASGIDASGKPTHFSYSAAYDGKFYPMIGNPIGNWIALKRIDARTIDATVKKGKAVSAYAKVTVSADGKHLTLARKTLRGKAAPELDTLAYVKQ